MVGSTTATFTKQWRNWPMFVKFPNLFGIIQNTWTFKEITSKTNSCRVRFNVFDAATRQAPTAYEGYAPRAPEKPWPKLTVCPKII